VFAARDPPAGRSYDRAAVRSWLLKAAVQGAISVLPGHHRLNALLQQHVTGSLELSEATFATKLRQCGHHLARFREARGADRPPRAALELGTGWYPIVPVGLALAGVVETTTVDISPLVDAQRAQRTFQSFAAAIQSDRLRDALPEIDPRRADAIVEAARDREPQTVDVMLARVGVSLRVGAVQAVGLEPGSMDLLVSNNTLEHVPPAGLNELLAELGRLSAPRAVMDHFIDISDHYAHFDRSITEFNYLRYRERAWRFFNNRLQYQNRLRAPDYKRLIENAGFRVICEEPERGAADKLSTTTLAPQFRHYARDDLLVLRTWITAVAES
jgi:hypothetical protein